MENTVTSQTTITQLGGHTIDALNLWTETQQSVLGTLLDLSTATVKEGLRLFADLQRATIDAIREDQTASTSWERAWKDGTADPAAWYQKAMTDGVTRAQRTFRLVEEQTQAVTRAAGRIQASTEQAGRGLQQTVTEAVARTKEIYARP